MGIWRVGPRPDIVDIAGIATVMRPVVEAWFGARLKIWDVKRGSAASDDYDPEEDTSPTPNPGVLVLDTGANGALVQTIRLPTRISQGSQPNAILSIRFQLKREVAPESGQVLRAGLQVQVVDGGNDSGLVGHTFSLVETIDSSLAWDRIWDAVLVTGAN
jgi:hypothetical protein